jgi:hypothetical protein
MPRPKAKIDMAELEKLYGMQCTDDEVAAFFGVSTRTIERRCQVKQFREAKERARAKGRVSVRRDLFRLASNGNIAAAIFLAKNLLGYRDVLSNEHSGPDGSPVATSIRMVVMEAGQQIDDEPKSASTVSVKVRRL